MISFIGEFFNILVDVFIVILLALSLLTSLFLFNFVFIVRRNIKDDEVEVENTGGSSDGQL